MQPSRRTTWAWLAATFFGAGYGKPGPGTYGSVAAVLLWLAAGRFGHLDIHSLSLVTFIGLVVTTAVGIPASTIVARESGRTDPGFVVIDEVAGQFFALLMLTPTFVHALLALVLFRLFDIFKPWPIRKLEALPNGTGIMLDDLAAGLFAHIVAHLLIHFIPRLA